MLKMLVAASVVLASPVAGQVASDRTIPIDVDRMSRELEPLCQIGFTNPRLLGQLIEGHESVEARSSLTMICAMYIKGATFQKRRASR